ncbi:MAG: hypothetical protein JO273_10050 [Methylobacteriaceae bacterium]|nr:hypothetical protein [Methylobacteriaceae bacterium]MBV9634127.1 hypothetical protein [Methylobacteriaceae bacterium]
MSLSTEPIRNAMAANSRASGPSLALVLAVSGACLIAVAAGVLWLRFGPQVFVNALNAAWMCM